MINFQAGSIQQKASNSSSVICIDDWWDSSLSQYSDSSSSIATRRDTSFSTAAMLQLQDSDKIPT